MIFWNRKIISGVLLILIASCVGMLIAFDLKNNTGFLHESKLIESSLKETLGYFEKRLESVTEDVVLGLFIAKANLQWVFNRIKYFKHSFWAEKLLKQLLKQINNIIELNQHKNVPILLEILWENAAGNLTYGLLNQKDDDFVLPKFDSCQSIDMYMMKGTPENSDICINELIKSNCTISEYCWLSEVNGDFHSGYKTSHRLLYFQLAFKMNCEKSNPKKFSGIRTIKKKLCQQMLWEANALFKDLSLSITRDLFMEQIALCGLEGYEEFAHDIWRNQVRKWQNRRGCFGLGSDVTCSAKKINLKMKKSSTVGDDCHSHVTAVATSALAFFLRTTLKMAFDLH